MSSTKEHWEKIYKTKQPDALSWTQAIPSASLAFVNELRLPKSARIIDIGGGDSTLADHLLDLGYNDITVLDISEGAIGRAKERLGKRAGSVQWISDNLLEFQPPVSYDLWHDRAAFHFLTSGEDIARYSSILKKGVSRDGSVIVATFSTTGPSKCSGLNITQYDVDSLPALFSGDFEKVDCHTEDHTTPFGTYQNFLYCLLRRRTGKYGHTRTA